MRSACVMLLLASVTARADDVAVLEPAPPPAGAPPAANPMPRSEAMLVKIVEQQVLHPQLQIDGGLSVIGPAYEYPVANHIAIALEAFVFGTYFLPWFDAGEEVKGIGLGLRATWFARGNGRGFYVTPYFRVVGVDDDNAIVTPSGIGFTTGAFAGWAFGLGDKLDLRVGAGAQYIHFHADGPDGRISSSTPFVAIDALLGYRL